MTWADVKASWSPSWVRLQAEAIETWGRDIAADPERFRDVVRAFANELAKARLHLDAVHTQLAVLGDRADDAVRRAVPGFEQRYADLAAGLLAEAEPAPAVGVAPIVVALVVVGIVVGLAAIAWSVAAYQYAVNLREQTALADRELAARIEASRDGRTLAPSTLPPPPPPPARGVPWALAGGAALVLGAVFLPTLWRR